MKRTIITVPGQVIDLPRAKLQCKITGSDRDTDVTTAIEAAREYAQEYLGVPVGSQDQRFVFDRWSGCVELPCDITEVLSVTSAGQPVEPLPTADERTLAFEAVAPVVITIKTGYTPTTVPPTVLAAMLLLIADLVRNPQKSGETQLYRNKTFDDMMWPRRERSYL